MSVSAELREGRAAYLASLLPPHVLARDERAGGLLHELLGVVAGELAAIETDLDTLYDAWFVETAPEWALPYLADLVGLVGLPGDFGPSSGASRRAVVANTVSYRQRKGTVAVLEQVVRDVTGWPAKAVEFHRLLATTAHINHLRPDRPAWGAVRGAASAELESARFAAGALTRFAHTGEVRHIDPGPAGGRGRYNITNVGVFVFPALVHGARGIPARRTAEGWSVHPLGFDQPLFARPPGEEDIEHLATEADLPVPLRPRRLLALLIAARAGADTRLPVSVRIDEDVPLGPDRVLVCGLEAAPGSGGAPESGWQVMVDPARGLLHPFHDGIETDPASLHIDHDAGSLAEVGAGTFDRSLAHTEALAGDPHDQDADPHRDRVAHQVPVRAAAPTPGHHSTVAQALTAIAAGWPATDAAEGGPGGTQVLSVADSEAYVGDLTVSVPQRRRLVLVAAGWAGRELLNGDVEPPVPGIYSTEGVRPRVVGDVFITGEVGSAMVLDGLVVEGDLVVQPGTLRALTVSHCTIAGTVRVLGAGDDGNRELVVAIRKSLLGGLDLAGTVPGAVISDSVVDPRLARLGGTGMPGPAAVGPAAHFRIDGSTLLGELRCRLLDVSSSICDGVVTVVDRQRGCARFSFFARGSRTPRRYRCVPPEDFASSTDRPGYLSIDPGSPVYIGLSTTTPTSIRRGGEFGAEMGAHHHLRRPLRMDGALRLVEPYVPAGMNLELFGS